MAGAPTEGGEFTTRFLASEGIPQYNALLDTHLRQHRKFLLGSKSNLDLLQTTGAIAKVEQGPSADQYIVYLDSPKPEKRAPAPKTDHGVPRQARKKATPLRSASAGCIRKKRLIEPLQTQPAPAQLATPTKTMVRHRSATTFAKADETKPTVNHLLESDLAYHGRILALQKEIAALDAEKKTIDKDIDQMRKQLRGVHAVQENDQAVAHCLSVVQHRFNKAEEEYMKAVTQQAAVRTSVDYLRQELLSLGQVQRKLELDIIEAQQKIVLAEERIATTKATGNETANELSELERQAEADSVERVLKLPPEDDFVQMDVPRMMALIHERAASREQALAAMKTNTAAVEAKEKAEDPATLPLKHKKAFETIQAELEVESLDAFIDTFIETENQLISLYKLDMEQQAEVKRADDQLTALEAEAEQMHVAQQAARCADASEREAILEKIRVAERKTEESLVERNHWVTTTLEHEALRAPILHLLEVLKTDKHFLQANGYIAAVQDMPLPAIVGIAQERIVELAILGQIKQKKVAPIEPKKEATIVVGPRVPISASASPMSPESVGSFDMLVSSTALPSCLSGDGAVDNTTPVSPEQLLQRALHQ
ncbi:hypothetical protein ACHHYP_10108 [Achlya hypogyna]|uniref:ODAD1 central coiled coil region domain-containing protein n=1 Tax=Achlya hypogyna TaxID=1202772 RepID=A0A1V9ZI48_ACHHY|nr:hypothetical protein ACHHYP_10108 [Achlya hypogyna]